MMSATLANAQDGVAQRGIRSRGLDPRQRHIILDRRILRHDAARQAEQQCQQHDDGHRLLHSPDLLTFSPMGETNAVEGMPDDTIVRLAVMDGDGGARPPFLIVVQTRPAD